MNIWEAIWREAMTPEDYRGQPYKAALNQFSHVSVGAFLSSLMSFVWFSAAGEMPVRGFVWISVVTAYMGVIEIWIQGLKKRDTFADTFFVAMGTALPLVTFEEVIVAGEVLLRPHYQPAIAGLLATIGFIAFHVWRVSKR